MPPQGPVLVEIISPSPGDIVGIEGVEVFVRLSPGGRVMPETMRVLLNGADVTAALTTGENGAYGKLHALLDGENVLRVEVFGRVPWGEGRLFEQSREVVVRLRRPLYPFRG